MNSLKYASKRPWTRTRTWPRSRRLGEPAARGVRGVRGGRGRGGQGQAPVIREDDSGGEDELARHAEQDQADGINFTEDDEDHFLNLFIPQPRFHTRLFHTDT